MTRAIYPGTFDPLTSGHEDIMRRAGLLFDEVVLAIADSNAKNPLFTIDERIEMATAALAPIKNVRVIRFSGLLVNLVREHQGDVVLRGLRSVTDFDYEFQLAGMNRQLMPGIETIFMTPSDQYQFVSGTLVREISRLGGDVEKFVPPIVMQWIRERVPAQADRLSAKKATKKATKNGAKAGKKNAGKN
ncbi:MAG: pantetheine-phosphate adenylyltransferase [Burkholderiaceae bacterium]